jgi:hypothetical protein
MELRDFPTWRMANLWVILFLVVAAVVSFIPARPIWFGLVTDRAVNLILSVAAGVCINQIAKNYVAAFAAYDPANPLQAKRANEQIKLSATFANSVSTAVVAVLVLSQLVKNDPPDYFRIITGIAIAGLVHVGGRNLVALLKPEKTEDHTPFQP